ncbi:hypothetical protein TNCV_4944261 [Trichonephila clavipes]|nr:hypothetical protein TNCV_4944261 [Trichonephila clavipes]
MEMCGMEWCGTLNPIGRWEDVTRKCPRGVRAVRCSRNGERHELRGCAASVCDAGHRTSTHCPRCMDGRTATAGSDVVQSGRPIFDDFFQHLWPYIGNNTANVVFQMVKRLWLIRIDQ